MNEFIIYSQSQLVGQINFRLSMLPDDEVVSMSIAAHVLNYHALEIKKTRAGVESEQNLEAWRNVLQTIIDATDKAILRREIKVEY